MRYALLQAPELGLVVTALLGAWHYNWLNVGTALGLFGLWVVKEVALYPLYRYALREGPPTGSAALEGCCATTLTALSPQGHVRVRGERWAARTSNGDSIAPGSVVRVVGSDGLVLIVTDAEEPAG